MDARMIVLTRSLVGKVGLWFDPGRSLGRRFASSCGRFGAGDSGAWEKRQETAASRGGATLERC
jgi:hypothetical protein